MKKNNFIFTIMIIFLNIIFINVISAQNMNQKIDTLMNLYHNNNEFHGTVLVAQKGKVIYQKGFGYANREWGIPNKVNTKYRIASITKQFTSMLILQMVQKGVLDLNTPIIKYLPEYPEKNGKKITIHHLLSHTSGMPHYGGIPNFYKDKSRLEYTHEEYVHLFWKLKLLSEPGKKFSYSSFGYYLLGYILERTTGKSYRQLLKERIFDLAGMKNSDIENHRTISKNRAAGYNYSVPGFVNAKFEDYSTTMATGDIISTVSDLLKWDNALNKNLLLSSKYQKLLFKPNLGNYGYGWNIRKHVFGNKKSKITIVRHSGSTSGFESELNRIVKDKYLIVLLSNVENTKYIYDISKHIISILYNRPYKFKKSLTESLKKIIKTDGLDKALKQYKIMKINNKEEYDFKQMGLYFLGYQYNEIKKYKEAIKVINLLADEYPKSPWAFEFLGDIYKKMGNKKSAVTNYAKSLLLNPSNTSVIDKLSEIKKN